MVSRLGVDWTSGSLYVLNKPILSTPLVSSPETCGDPSDLTFRHDRRTKGGSGSKVVSSGFLVSVLLILRFPNGSVGVGDVPWRVRWEVGVLVPLLLDDDDDDDDDDADGVGAPREDPDGEAVGENVKLDVDLAISRDL